MVDLFKRGALAHCLANLPVSAIGIALTLKRLGITGMPSDPCGCPIAEYVSLSFPGYTVSVMEGTVKAERMAGRVRQMMWEPMPRGVKEFIARFDNGHEFTFLLHVG